MSSTHQATTLLGKFIALLSLCVMAGTVLSAEPTSTSLDRFFRDLDNLTASFEQTISDAQGKVTQTANGRLSIQRPGRFRWDYDTPYKQLVLGDGQKLWTYDVDLEQATVKPQQDALAGTPALLLSAKEQPRTLFKVAPLPMRDDEEWFELTPHAQDTQFNQIRLGFLNDQLVAMELVDGFDQLTQFRFNDLQVNGPVSAQIFRFVPPKGVDVIGDAP
ncbi:MAG: outer membrane lipoprotein chaperone LolA [Gammaproteobacteria bacterium]|nr:outer membrane lipoprotein chaperone LolA [Gammaproteobacteria bacterium]